jgi:hypothetical protein
MRSPLIKLALIACAVMLTSLALRADTIDVPFDVQILPGSEVPHTFPSPPTVGQFNPALGTLTEVTVTLRGTDTWTQRLGPDSLEADLYYGDFSTTQSFTSPGMLAFDLAGTSTTNLADFIGTSDYTLELALNTDGLGDIGATTLNGTVTYDYTPPASAPEPSSLSLTLLSLGAGGLFALWTRKRSVLMHKLS